MAKSKLTRSELYALVWEKPVTRLAREFGISDVALHKICRKHSVPTPPPGYWAKKAHSKAVPTVPLPAGDEAAICIGGGQVVSGAVRAAREKATRTIISRPGVDDHLPLVQRTVARLRHAKVDAQGLVTTSGTDCIRVRASPAVAERIGHILSRMFCALEARGIGVVVDEMGNRFDVEGEQVGFSLSEIVDRQPHELTEAERRSIEKWEAKRERSAKRRDWDWHFRLWDERPQTPPYDYTPTGRLSLQFEQAWVNGSIRRTFADTKTQDLERMGDTVAIGVVTYATAIRERREENERRERAWAEQERRRQEAERRAALKKKRVSALDTLLDHSDRLDRIERLLARLPQVAVEDGTYARFSAWLTAYTASLRIGLEPESIERWFDEQHLFDKGDD